LADFYPIFVLSTPKSIPIQLILSVWNRFQSIFSRYYIIWTICAQLIYSFF